MLSPETITLDTFQALVADRGKTLKRARTQARRAFMDALDQTGLYERLAYCPIRLRGAVDLFAERSVAPDFGQAAFEAGLPAYGGFVPPAAEKRREMLQVICMGEPETALLAALQAAEFRRAVQTDSGMVVFLGEGVLTDLKVYAGSRVTVGRRLIPEGLLIDTDHGETATDHAGAEPKPATKMPAINADPMENSPLDTPGKPHAVNGASEAGGFGTVNDEPAPAAQVASAASLRLPHPFEAGSLRNDLDRGTKAHSDERSQQSSTGNLLDIDPDRTTADVVENPIMPDQADSTSEDASAEIGPSHETVNLAGSEPSHQETATLPFRVKDVNETLEPKTVAVGQTTQLGGDVDLPGPPTRRAMMPGRPGMRPGLVTAGALAARHIPHVEARSPLSATAPVSSLGEAARLER